jgi:hypothetical protein
MTTKFFIPKKNLYIELVAKIVATLLFLYDVLIFFMYITMFGNILRHIYKLGLQAATLPMMMK